VAVNDEERKQAEEVALELLRSKHGSRSGKQWRAAVCVITRNARHLREFIIRNLYIGFSHIVVLDNNRVEQGQDLDLEPVLAPFVARGLVTHQMLNRSASARLLEVERDRAMHACARDTGALADWVAPLDDDEILYLEEEEEEEREQEQEQEGKSRARDALDALLRRWEAEERCAGMLQWELLYGEQRTLAPAQQLLMDAYPRRCLRAWQTKPLLRPRLARHSVHKAFCYDPATHSVATPNITRARILHYYQRSIEEFLGKMEQRLPPYARTLQDYYWYNQRCQPEAVELSAQYVEDVRRIDALLTAAGWPAHGRLLLQAGELLSNETGLSLQDLALYQFMKIRVLKRESFDPEGYLRANPDVAANLRVSDALHHFLNWGWAAGLTSCWIREAGERFCLTRTEKEGVV
jgi:hypothetical protein